MPQGQYIKLASAIEDDTTRRFYTASSLLNKGSLLYIKPKSSLSGVSTFPANGTVIRNLAWDIAKSMIPAATEANLQSVISSDLLGGVASFSELTPKKGFHVIISKVNDVQAGNDFFIKHSADIKNYILDNPTHEIFSAEISKRTRIADTSNSADYYLMQNTSIYFQILQRDDVVPNSANSARYVGSYGALSQNVVGNRIRMLATKGFSGGLPSDRTLLKFENKIGSGGAYASFEVNKAASIIFYEMYVEDLTVSGLTYAQAQAKMLAYYTAAFSSGGEYFGDIHTDPATLP